MQTKIVTTKDGSHSLFVPSLGEHYHSTFGAIRESQHVFVNCGFLAHASKDLQILEIGFGTGLNALLTSIAAKETKRKVHFTTLENNVLPIDIIENLNYTEVLKIPKSSLLLLHSSKWNTKIQINEFFSLEKINTDWTHYKLKEKYDVVYYDAFAPDYQTEMWDKILFKKVYEHMNPQGVITTYTVKGDVKRKLQQSGFSIEKLKGPKGGKNEMLRGIKTS